MSSSQQQIRDYLKEELGEIPPMYETLRRYAPESFAAISEIRRGALTEGKLPKKVKELILIGIETALRLPVEPHARLHAKAAVKAGASPEEIHEAVEVALMIAGLSSYAGYGHAVVEFAEKYAKKRRGL